jgi:putative RecB family exonuclease
MAVQQQEEEPRVVGSLSPSRAADFLSCPLMYRFRTVDRLPEPSSPEAVRGTLVHKVLEDIFDLPAAERTRETAHAMLEPTWDALRAEDPRTAGVLDGVDEQAWLAAGRDALDQWFGLEDPTRLEPAEREAFVECLLDSGLMLRGIIDRVDVAPDGSVRVSDYKTGNAVGEGGEARALFQLRFYGLMIWRTRGVVPKVIRLVYLGDGQIIAYEPDEADLLATERKIQAIWAAILQARASGDYQPSPGRNCDWCAHHALCPVFGGTPPPIPARRPSRAEPPPSRGRRLLARVRRALLRRRRRPRP